MPCHDDVASEVAIFVVKPGDPFTFGSGEKIFENRPSVGVEMLQEARPISRLVSIVVAIPSDCLVWGTTPMLVSFRRIACYVTRLAGVSVMLVFAVAMSAPRSHGRPDDDGVDVGRHRMFHIGRHKQESAYGIGREMIQI